MDHVTGVQCLLCGKRYKTDEIEISIDMTIDNYIHLTDITDDEIIYA